MMVEMIAQNFFNLVDMYFVSKISYLAIGALVSCSIVLMVIFSVFIGLSTATGIFVASFWGAKKFSRAYYYYSNAFSIVVISSFVFSGLVFFLVHPILSVIGLAGLTKLYAYQYLSVLSLSLMVIFIFSLNNSTLRSCSLPSLVVKVMVMANLLNVGFDPLFIFYFKMGIKGAAVSTILSLIIGIFLQVVFLRRNGFYFIFKLKKSVVTQLFNKGIFASLHLFFRITSMLVLIRFVSGFSQAALSAYSTVIRIYQVLLFLVFGLANTSFVIVGQNYGARMYDRIKKGAYGVILTGLLFVGLIDVVIYIFRDPALSVFISIASVRALAESIVFFYFISYPFVVVSTIAARSSMALQDTKRPSMANLVNLWFFLLPVAYFLSKKYGVTGIWIAIALSNFTSFLANIFILNLNIKRVSSEIIHV